MMNSCSVHGSWMHLVCVLAVELVMGLLQETVHGSLSVGLIFTAGVLAGSLSSFVFSPFLALIGGSAGCYALIGAQLASLLLNWHEDHAIVIRNQHDDSIIRSQQQCLASLKNQISLALLFLSSCCLCKVV